jgi:hypothetical protein
MTGYGSSNLFVVKFVELLQLRLQIIDELSDG